MRSVKTVSYTHLLTLSLTACSGGASPAPSSNADTTAQAQNSADKTADGDTQAASSDSDEPIVIGFLGWSSGPDSLYGLVPQYLLTDYFKEVNLNGGWLGREIDFRTYDVSGLGGDFSEAVNATNKLIQAGVDVIIGPSNSTQSTAVAEICNREGVLHIPSGSSAIVTVDEKGETRPWTFRAGPENSDFLINIANYAYHELNNPKIAVLYETTQIDCVNMRDTFVSTLESLGGTFVGEATYQIDDQEFRAQLRNLAEKEDVYKRQIRYHVCIIVGHHAAAHTAEKCAVHQGFDFFMEHIHTNKLRCILVVPDCQRNPAVLGPGIIDGQYLSLINI